MGKGLSKRHRAQRAQNANEGNLHKVAIGKAGATVHIPLPDAPKADELLDRMPKSLQKMMKYKVGATAMHVLAPRWRGALHACKQGRVMTQHARFLGSRRHARTSPFFLVDGRWLQRMEPINVASRGATIPTRFQRRSMMPARG